MSVLVFVEQVEGKIKKSGLEAVSYAKAIAEMTSTKLSALVIGNVADEQLNTLAKYGAEKIIKVGTASLQSFVNQAYAAVISDLAKSEGANIVVLSNSFSGKGLAPRIAVKLTAGLVDGAVDLPDLSGGFKVKKAAFSGKAFAMVSLNSANKVIALSPNAYGLKENECSANIEQIEPTVNPADLSTVIKEIVRNSDKISLPEAEIVVSAGRGLKGPENWGMIEELASLLGAATACSKPVSDAGWRPHSEHVGQTGITVSPNLYIAIGISGAIQHLAGVSSSKVIVVINKDAEAPFFKVADYGIVGDAFEVVPKLIAALKAYKA